MLNDVANIQSMQAFLQKFTLLTQEMLALLVIMVES